MSDIDHFKSFNDRFGHAVGDQVIEFVANTLDVGVGEDDLLCRYGGEEFCTMLPGADIDAAVRIAEQLRAQIEAEGGSVVKTTSAATITSSFGVASIRGGARDPAALIDQADQALYASKDSGRNKVTCFAAMSNTERAPVNQPAPQSA